MLTKAQGTKLLKLARESIQSSFSGNHAKVNDELKKEFSENQGVFVTLHEHGMLRGCIGYPMPILPLYEAVISAARSAAFQDPRFPPLKEEEIDKIDLEISVLTVPELIESTENIDDKIKIGENGLIIKSGLSSGLLLPQVATEYNWTVEEFLINTCHKAGLHPEAWKEDNVKLYKFQAQIFKEKNI